MKSKLARFNISPASKIIIFSWSMMAFAVTGIYHWEKNSVETVEYSPWKVTGVNSGSNFIASRRGELKSINLCGVATTGKESKEFLTSMLNSSNGKVNLQQFGNGYEAWMFLEQDYDPNLVKHISTKPNYLMGKEIHLNTWIIARGLAKRDRNTFRQCREPDNLVWAEKAAKEDKLEIWQ